MTNYSTRTIGDVLDYLKDHETKGERREVQLGNQMVTTVNDEVVRVINGEPVLPVSQHKMFAKIVKELKLSRSDNINRQSSINQSTVIISATVHHNPDLVSTILNFGGDPSIADGHGNNAFIYAADSAHSSILKEFLTLIHEEEPVKQQHKRDDQPEQKAPAATLQKAETVVSPRSAELQQPPKKSLEAPAERVKLDSKVLLFKNAVGETPEHLIKVYRQNHQVTRAAAEARLKEDRKRQAAKLSGRRVAPVKTPTVVSEEDDHVERFKKLVDEVHQLQKRSAPAPKAALDENRNAYQEKLNKVRNLYNKFVYPKLPFFNDQFKLRARIDPDQTSFVRERELLRVKEGFDAIYPGTVIPMPAYFEDRAKVKAALALIKDYYAPERAPVSRFFQWGALRRLLTFHTGRRYCAKAEDLHTELQFNGLNSVGDIMRVIKVLETRFKDLTELDHDKKHKNSIFNSSYTRRLFYIIEELKKTKAYQYSTIYADVSPQVMRTQYLNDLDVKNMVAGILPFSKELPRMNAP